MQESATDRKIFNLSTYSTTPVPPPENEPEITNNSKKRTTQETTQKNGAVNGDDDFSTSSSTTKTPSQDQKYSENRITQKTTAVQENFRSFIYSTTAVPPPEKEPEITNDSKKRTFRSQFFWFVQSGSLTEGVVEKSSQVKSPHWVW